VLVGALGFGLLGSAVGGTIGAIQGIDDHLWIEGSEDNCRKDVPRLKKQSILSATPKREPPRLPFGLREQVHR